MKANSPLARQLTERFFLHNRLTFALAAFAALVSGFTGLIVSWFLKALIDTASSVPEALPLGSVLRIIGGSFLVILLIALLDRIVRPAFIRRAMTQYKDYAFQKLTEKGIASFRDESTTAYLSALTNDAGSIEANYLAQLLSLFTKAVMFFGSIALMLWYSPLLTAISVGVTLLPLIASVLTGNRLVVAEKRVSDRNRDFTASLTDCLNGFSVIKSFRAEREIFRMFSASNQVLEEEKCARERVKALVGMIGSLAGMLAQLGVFVAGANMILSGYGLTSGTVIMFVNLMNFMIEPVSALPGLLAGRKAALGLIRKLADALEKNPETAGTVEMTALRRGIKLENVTFGYEAGKDILHGVSAVFEAGKAYAVVGSSGSGKSTLLNLLMASFSAYSGRILLDGAEITQIRPESLYSMISVIQQNVFVFNASIRDNVTMFRVFPQEEMDDAIRHAHLDGLLSDRGEAYLCGESGNGLSGGEKQRVSIARSLLKKSSILLADEVTAALDKETAWQVSNDILDLNGITRIVVTHSLEESLLRRYDGILVLKDGRVAESGTFDELMASGGYFHALFTVAQ